MTDVEQGTVELAAGEMKRLGLDPANAGKLAAYVSLVVRWGRRVNLTGRPEAASFIQRQLPDGLVLAERLTDVQGPHSLLDVGTGAGVPGLVVGLLCPHVKVTLVEHNQRRCSFLRTAIFELGIRCDLLDESLEHVASQLSAKVSLACSRATWPPRSWLDRAQHLVGSGGQVVAFLSGDADEPAPPPPLLRFDEHSYELEDGTRRRLLFYRKV